MSDGRIEIDAELKANGIYQELQQMKKEFNKVSNEMKLSNMKAMLPYQKRLMEVKKSFFDLSREMGNYTGTNKQFMGTVDELGKKQKKANDDMINANKMIGVSMIQTAGQMMNMSTQASKISSNYDRMKNPIYAVNKAGLAVADTMNKIANSGNAAVLSLKMLGPNASMKKLNDMQMMINQGVMRFQTVAMGAMIAGGIMYSSLHKAAMKANAGYSQSFNTMIASLKKALEPMIQVFASVMIPVFNFITAIARITIEFNKAHPVLAKIIQGFVMLLPALTLLLSPLAIGIGLVNGMAAAFGALWMFIGPSVTGLAAMSGTVIAVAAAVAILVGGLVYLWKTNEGFRNAIVGAWDAIKAKAIEVFGMFSPLITSVANGFKTLGSAIVAVFSGDFSQLGAILAQIMPTLIGILVGGIPGLIISASRFIPAIAQGITSNAGQLSTTITSIVTSITTFLTTQLPIFIQQGVAIITGLVQGIATGLPIIMTALMGIITMIVPLITQLLPVLLNAGIQIITALIQGITTVLPVIATTLMGIITMIVPIITQLLPVLLGAGIQIVMTLVQGILTILPVLIQTGLTLITTLVTTIVQLIPTLLSTGIQILTTLIDGIVSMLPALINTAITLITQILQTLLDNLPIILNAGINVVLALVDGIISMLPSLIDTALNLIMTIVTMLVNNLPKILDAGIQILMALINGIIQVLPQLIDTAVNLILKVVMTLIDNLPKIIDSGVQLLMALITGIVKMLPQLINLAIDLIIKVAAALIQALPKILDAGVKLILALIKGIISLVGQLGSAIKNDIIPAIVDTLRQIDLLSIGKDIINGLISGIGSMYGSVKAKIEELASNIPDWAKKMLGIHSPSKVMKKDVGYWISEGIADGITANTKAEKAAKAKAQAIIKAFNSDLKGLKLDYSAGKINSTQYIKELEKLKKANSDYSIGAKQINVEISKVEKKHIDERNKANIAAYKQRFKDDKTSYENKSKLNSTSMQEELATLKMLAGSYKKNSDERKYFENLALQKKQEITQAKQKIDEDYLKKVQELNQKFIDEEKKLNDEYDQALKDRENSLKNFVGLFDQVTKNDVSGVDLIVNLHGQVDAFTQWQKDMSELASKGIGDELYKQLQEMGPSAGSEIAALNSLTGGQLDEYVGLWKEKSALAKDEAIKELEPLKAETASKIDDLKKTTAQKLLEYQNDWQTSMRNVTGTVKNEMDAMPSIGKYAISGLIQGMKDKRKELIATANEMANAIKKTLQGALKIHSPSQWMRDMIGKNMMLGWKLGIDGEKNDTINKTKEMASWIMPEIPGLSNLLSPSLVPAGVPSSNSRQGTQIITVELDGRTIGKAVAPTVAEEITVRTRRG